MDQMILEQQMLQAGADRYARAQAKAGQRNEMTSAQDRLFKVAVGKVTEAMEKALEESSGRGAKPAWHLPVSTLGPLKAAVLTLKTAFSNMARGSVTLPRLIEDIGEFAVIEMVVQAVETKDTAAYKKLVKKAKRLTYGLAYKSEKLTDMMKQEGFWQPFEATDASQIGGALFSFVLQATDLFCIEVDGDSPTDTPNLVVFTTEAVERLKEIEGREAWMRPVYGPMVTPPRAWESAFTGCYQDPRLSNTFKVIKTGNREHLKKVDAAIQAGAPFAKALNVIQAVPLRINAFVLEWVERAWNAAWEVKSFPSRARVEIPEDAAKWKKRELKQEQREIDGGQANFLNDVEEAKHYASLGTFYLPGQLDWRGRVYCKPHLNHQREDHIKALFEFGNGKPLDAAGAVWLAIQVATTGGFRIEGHDNPLDKLPLDVRYQWTRDNTERLVSMIKDPAADRWWLEADSPFCFLAAAHAWAEYQEKGDDYICHLPVNVDGSCSGLQHFSAMLRDPIGATHVNLLPQDLPADVYRAVSNEVAPLVEADAAQGNVFAIRWMSIGINRKIAKRCVMTYVYGSKVFGFGEHLADDFEKELMAIIEPEMVPEAGEEDWAFNLRKKRELRSTASYLAKYIWASVQKTVKAAAEAMDWLQETASLLASEGKPMSWVTPMGFPVINAYYKPNVERVDLFLYDRTLNIPKRVRSSVKTGDTDELIKTKCRSSISPNFVHSMDSSHLQAAVLKAAEEGITDFLLIHDSFGCLPTDMSRYVQIVRETLVEQYTNSDPLQDLHDRALGALSDEGKKKLKPPPAKGTFDLNLVLESHYAFA